MAYPYSHSPGHYPPGVPMFIPPPAPPGTPQGPAPALSPALAKPSSEQRQTYTATTAPLGHIHLPRAYPVPYYSTGYLHPQQPYAQNVWQVPCPVPPPPAPVASPVVGGLVRSPQTRARENATLEASEASVAKLTSQGSSAPRGYYYSGSQFTDSQSYLAPGQRSYHYIPCHVCSVCNRPRSKAYHSRHPLIPGQFPAPGVCRRCRSAESPEHTPTGQKPQPSPRGPPRGPPKECEAIQVEMKTTRSEPDSEQVRVVTRSRSASGDRQIRGRPSCRTRVTVRETSQDGGSVRPASHLGLRTTKSPEEEIRLGRRVPSPWRAHSRECPSGLEGTAPRNRRISISLDDGEVNRGRPVHSREALPGRAQRSHSSSHARRFSDVERRIASHPSPYRHGRFVYSNKPPALPPPPSPSAAHRHPRRPSREEQDFGQPPRPASRASVTALTGIPPRPTSRASSGPPAPQPHGGARERSREPNRERSRNRSVSRVRSILRSPSRSRYRKRGPSRERQERRSAESTMVDVGGHHVQFAAEPARHVLDSNAEARPPRTRRRYRLATDGNLDLSNENSPPRAIPPPEILFAEAQRERAEREQQRSRSHGRSRDRGRSSWHDKAPSVPGAFSPPLATADWSDAGGSDYYTAGHDPAAWDTRGSPWQEGSLEPGGDKEPQAFVDVSVTDLDEDGKLSKFIEIRETSELPSGLSQRATSRSGRSTTDEKTEKVLSGLG